MSDPGPSVGFGDKEYQDIEIVDGKNRSDGIAEPLRVDIAAYKLQRCAY